MLTPDRSVYWEVVIGIAVLLSGCFPVVTAIQSGSNPIDASIINRLKLTDKVLVLPVWGYHSDRGCHISQSFTSRVSDLSEAGERFHRLGLGWWVADGHGISHGLHLDGVLVLSEDGVVLWSGYQQSPRERFLAEELADQLIAEVSEKYRLKSLHELHELTPGSHNEAFWSLCFRSTKYPRFKASPAQRDEFIRFVKDVRANLAKNAAGRSPTDD